MLLAYREPEPSSNCWQPTSKTNVQALMNVLILALLIEALTKKAKGMPAIFQRVGFYGYVKYSGRLGLLYGQVSRCLIYAESGGLTPRLHPDSRSGGDYRCMINDIRKRSNDGQT